MRLLIVVAVLNIVAAAAFSKSTVKAQVVPQPTAPYTGYLPLVLQAPSPTPTPTPLPTPIPTKPAPQVWAEEHCQGLVVTELVRNGGFETVDHWIVHERDRNEVEASSLRPHTGRASLAFPAFRDEKTEVWQRPGHRLWPWHPTGQSGDLVSGYLSAWVWWASDGPGVGRWRDRLALWVAGCREGTGSEDCVVWPWVLGGRGIQMSDESVEDYDMWVLYDKDVTEGLRRVAHDPNITHFTIEVDRSRHYDFPATVYVDDVSLVVCTRP